MRSTHKPRFATQPQPNVSTIRPPRPKQPLTIGKRKSPAPKRLQNTTKMQRFASDITSQIENKIHDLNASKTAPQLYGILEANASTALPTATGLGNAEASGSSKDSIVSGSTWHFAFRQLTAPPQLIAKQLGSPSTFNHQSSGPKSITTLQVSQTDYHSKHQTAGKLLP